MTSFALSVLGAESARGLVDTLVIFKGAGLLNSFGGTAGGVSSSIGLADGVIVVIGRAVTVDVDIVDVGGGGVVEGGVDGRELRLCNLF